MRTIRHLLGHSPGHTAAMVATLALVIGANSAMFGAVRAVLLEPLPMRAPGDVIVGWGSDSSRNLPVIELAYRRVEALASATRSFTDVAAMSSSNWTMTLDVRGERSRIPYTAVTSSFFDTLGVRPLLGRTFAAADDAARAAGVVILNYGTWASRFGADAGIIGRTITLDAKPYTVIGVMPRGFDFPRGAELWTPVVPILTASSATWKQDGLSDVGVLFMLGRLRTGVTREGAAADLTRAASSAIVTTPFLDYLLGPVRTALWLLFAAVGVLLLIACANVSALMLTRMARRQHEDAVKLALGATGVAIARAWIAEIVVVFAAGGLAGLAVSRVVAAAIVALAPDDVPRLAEVSIDVPVAAFTAAAVCGVALLCGVVVARHGYRVNIVDALSDGARGIAGSRSHRSRSALLALQAALAVVLLVAAGLVLRSFVNVRAVDLGFVPDNVLTMGVSRHTTPSPGPSPNEWIGELLRRVEALRGVDAAGAISLPPLALGAVGADTRVVLEGQPNTPRVRQMNPLLNHQVASPGYFAATRIALKRGRLFDAADDSRAPRVVLLGETAARRLFPGENPIGRKLAMPALVPGETQLTWRTVVGVVADVRYRGLGDARLDVYEPFQQTTIPAGHLVIRAADDPLALAGAVRRQALALDPLALVEGMTTMEAVVGRVTAPWRLGAWALTVFAALALVLALVGLFSVVSLEAASRRQELAIRAALGAARRDLLRAVMTGTARWAAAGAALGLVAAAAAARAMRGLLFGVQALDGFTYAAVILLVVAVAGIASYLPARRAAAVDAMTLLRRN